MRFDWRKEYLNAAKNAATSAAENERLRAALQRARGWLQACLELVDGNGNPPNWDGIRAFLKETL